MPTLADTNPAGSKQFTQEQLDAMAASLDAPSAPPTRAPEKSTFQKFVDSYKNAGPGQRIGAAAGGLLLPALATGPGGWLAGAGLAALGAGGGGALGELADRYSNPIGKYVNSKGGNVPVGTPPPKEGEPFDYYGPAADSISTLMLSGLAKGAGTLAAKGGAPRAGGILAAETPANMAYRVAPAAAKAPGMPTPALEALDKYGAEAGLPGMQREAAHRAALSGERADAWMRAESANRAVGSTEDALRDAAQARAAQAGPLKQEVERALSPGRTSSSSVQQRVEKTTFPPGEPPVRAAPVETSTTRDASISPTDEELASAMRDPASVWKTADDPAVSAQKFLQEQLARRSQAARATQDEIARREAQARALEAMDASRHHAAEEAGYASLASPASKASIPVMTPIGHAHVPLKMGGISPDRAGQAVASTLMQRGGTTANPALAAYLSRNPMYKAAAVPQGLDELLRRFLARNQPQGGTK